MDFPIEYILKYGRRPFIFTNGCFDIIHAGHIFLLKKCKEYVNYQGSLIVGLNSDESIKRLKGHDRPINCYDDRCSVLSSIKYVDYIARFEEDTPSNLISRLIPNIYVKGGDYSVDKLPEADIILSYGGKVKIVPHICGKSTTNLIEKIKNI